MPADLTSHVKTSNMLFASRSTLQTRVQALEKQNEHMARELDDAWKYAQKLEARLNEALAERDGTACNARAQKDLARFQDASIRELMKENERLKRTLEIMHAR